MSSGNLRGRVISGVVDSAVEAVDDIARRVTGAGSAAPGPGPTISAVDMGPNVSVTWKGSTGNPVGTGAERGWMVPVNAAPARPRGRPPSPAGPTIEGFDGGGGWSPAMRGELIPPPPRPRGKAPSGPGPVIEGTDRAWNAGMRGELVPVSRPRPTTTSATPSAANSGFWNTSVAQGTGQMLGMGLLGGGIGAAGAWMTGGNVSQGFMMGGLAGMVGGAYNPGLRQGFREGVIEAQRFRIGRETMQARQARRAGTMTKEQAAKGRQDRLSRLRKLESARATTNNGRAAATAAGAGLMGGVMFSGHRRKNVGGYNSRRGNYIGG